MGTLAPLQCATDGHMRGWLQVGRLQHCQAEAAGSRELIQRLTSDLEAAHLQLQQLQDQVPPFLTSSHICAPFKNMHEKAWMK